MSKMDVVDFPSNVPARVGLGQMLFLHAMAIPAPPPQFTVVVVTTEPRTPEQYDGLIVTQQKAAAVSKGKGKVVPTLSDESDYGESLSMHEQESEEGELVAQRFQCMQYNKKLAPKKARKAKAEDGWREISEDDQYCLLFKHDKERALPESPEAKSLYYYISMDPNQVHLWKRMAAHSLPPLVPTATNIAPMESSVVAAMTVSGPSAPLGPVPASQEPATNIATGDVTMALESGEVPVETVGSGL
ncbi:hypothetical protein C0995_011532 [Termitomyces sp. Mi166|nr:hypothetical protein C0995_011532 [Termitomyces sp. Mi166\